MKSIQGNKANSINKLLDFRQSVEYVNHVKRIVNQEFQKHKQILISEFSSHPVTVELEGGVSASNISNTLGGKGNLFAFIGFNSGDSPTQPIHFAFNNISLTQVLIKRDGRSESFVLYPSVDDIFKITPLPWADGRSWAEGIEDGISNLGHFLAKPTDDSRSGGGIQSKNQVSTQVFSKTPYISAMISKFENSIKNLDSLKI
jgi:hypothetical protein